MDIDCAKSVYLTGTYDEWVEFLATITSDEYDQLESWIVQWNEESKPE